MRDFVHVDDAARALLTLADQAKIGGSIFNVCSAKGTTIHDLATMIVTLANCNPERILFSGDRRVGDPIYWIGCNKNCLTLVTYSRDRFQKAYWKLSDGSSLILLIGTGLLEIHDTERRTKRHRSLRDKR